MTASRGCGSGAIIPIRDNRAIPFFTTPARKAAKCSVGTAPAPVPAYTIFRYDRATPCFSRAGVITPYSTPVPFLWQVKPGVRKQLRIPTRLTPPLLLLVEGIGPTGNPNDPHNQFACSFLFLHDNYCHVQTDGTTAYFRCFADPDGAVYAPFGTCLVNTGTADVPAPVHVWPNPAGDRLFVRGDCQSLLLYDACGRALLEQKIRAGDTVEIPVTQLPDGAYFLVCRLENGKTYVHKTVLSR